HKLVMTTVVVVNWVLIALLMANSYRSVVEFTPNRSDINFILPTIHLLTGSLAQIMGTYLVLLMWTENTPMERLILIRTRAIKTPMRLTLSLWLVTILLGFGIYGLFNAPSVIAEEAPSPVVTEEVIPEAQSTEAAPAPDATEEIIIDELEETEEPERDAPEPASTEES
ncbi:MAG: hypothetical protein KC496_19300, partial [Anaerolineae bacterium]|nr:hypothetical protein [Anaerolineae bacterium]